MSQARLLPRRDDIGDRLREAGHGRVRRELMQKGLWPHHYSLAWKVLWAFFCQFIAAFCWRRKNGHHLIHNDMIWTFVRWAVKNARVSYARNEIWAGIERLISGCLRMRNVVRFFYESRQRLLYQDAFAGNFTASSKTSWHSAFGTLVVWPKWALTPDLQPLILDSVYKSVVL